MGKEIFISVIIPVYNSARHIDKCLDALINSTYNSFEIIVVDDFSTDDSVEISERKGVNVHRLAHKSGPSAARNFGAKMAKGDILLFVDSDVVVRTNTIERVAMDFVKHPEIVAVFGSYDDSPAAVDVLSQFRNLFHHFIHQNSDPNAKTFWAGCGAIAREQFLESQGFNERLYPKPSIEDIELGTRMSRKGYKIMLDKELQVKHLKQWRWRNWLMTDILNRAYPWSKLIIENRLSTSDLNLKFSYRLSSILAILFFLSIILVLLDTVSILRTGFFSYLLIFSIFLMISIIILNFNVYKFFFEKRGVTFTLISIPLHFVYYIYSGFTFTFCWVLNKFPSF